MKTLKESELFHKMVQLQKIDYNIHEDIESSYDFHHFLHILLRFKDKIYNKSQKKEINVIRFYDISKENEFYFMISFIISVK